jgi:dolichol-phosphate hexosyltransferase
LERTVKVVCVIPTLNESATVAEVVQKAKQLADRVVVVDGHSDDGTCEIASQAGADVILQDGEGKGMALRTVFNKIEEDVCVILDGDATYDPLEMEKIIKPILDDEADMVVGSRLNDRMEEGAITQLNRVGNGFFNFLINIFFNGNVTDSQSGYRALNRKAFESLSLSSKGFEVETEMTIQALKQGLKVKEIPITYTRRRGTQSKLNSFKAGSSILKMIINSSLGRF